MRRRQGFATVALPLFASLALAQWGGDLQARIVYAYETEDGNQLANLVEDLSTRVKSDGADAALRYHLAHAEYRFGLLASGKRAREAAPAFTQCIDQLKPILAQDGKSVEALVLQSACYGELAARQRLEAVLLRARAQERLGRASGIDPRNPRVLYFEAQEGLAEAKPNSPDGERAFRQLAESAQIFDRSSATREDVPGWGQSQAYLAYGTQLARRGDAVGARNWIEKALIVAPDYKAAQRELASLVRR